MPRPLVLRASPPRARAGEVSSLGAGVGRREAPREVRREKALPPVPVSACLSASLGGLGRGRAGDEDAALDKHAHVVTDVETHDADPDRELARAIAKARAAAHACDGVTGEVLSSVALPFFYHASAPTTRTAPSATAPAPASTFAGSSTDESASERDFCAASGTSESEADSRSESQGTDAERAPADRQSTERERTDAVEEIEPSSPLPPQPVRAASPHFSRSGQWAAPSTSSGSAASAGAPISTAAPTLRASDVAVRIHDDQHAYSSADALLSREELLATLQARLVRAFPDLLPTGASADEARFLEGMEAEMEMEVEIEREDVQDTISGMVVLESRTPRFVRSPRCDVADDGAEADADGDKTARAGLIAAASSGAPAGAGGKTARPDLTIRVPSKSAVPRGVSTADLQGLSPCYLSPLLPAKKQQRLSLPDLWALPVDTGSLFQRRNAARKKRGTATDNKLDLKAAAVSKPPALPLAPSRSDSVTSNTEQDASPVTGIKTVRVEGCETWLACTACEGKRRVACTLCHGVPADECSHCGGHGVDPFGSGHLCTDCAGRGFVACASCNGKASVPCGECRAEGKYPADLHVEVERKVVALPSSPVELFSHGTTTGEARSPIELLENAKHKIAAIAEELASTEQEQQASVQANPALSPLTAPTAATCTWNSTVVRVVSIAVPNVQRAVEAQRDAAYDRLTGRSSSARGSSDDRDHQTKRAANCAVRIFLVSSDTSVPIQEVTDDPELRELVKRQRKDRQLSGTIFVDRSPCKNGFLPTRGTKRESAIRTPHQAPRQPLRVRFGGAAIDDALINGSVEQGHFVYPKSPAPQTLGHSDGGYSSPVPRVVISPPSDKSRSDKTESYSGSSAHSETEAQIVQVTAVVQPPPTPRAAFPTGPTVAPSEPSHGGLPHFIPPSASRPGGYF